ncbi:uncharacterized protein UDID_17523 [Ustilago sp. UG-2017a]|nr:uncharacterized protein UDID_17523 [Ustilago sp. UG-2017a]
MVSSTTNPGRTCNITLTRADLDEICNRAVPTTNLSELCCKSYDLPDSLIPALPSYELTDLPASCASSPMTLVFTTSADGCEQFGRSRVRSISGSGKRTIMDLNVLAGAGATGAKESRDSFQSSKNLADVLTKPLTAPRLLHVRELFGLTTPKLRTGSRGGAGDNDPAERDLMNDQGESI